MNHAFAAVEFGTVEHDLDHRSTLEILNDFDKAHGCILWRLFCRTARPARGWRHWGAGVFVSALTRVSRLTPGEVENRISDLSRIYLYWPEGSAEPLIKRATMVIINGRAVWIVEWSSRLRSECERLPDFWRGIAARARFGITRPGGISQAIFHDRLTALDRKRKNG